MAARLRAIAAGSTIGIAFLGGAVLFGWILDVPVLKSVHPSLVSMKANTAIGFLLSGVALWLVHGADPNARRRRMSRALSAAIVLVGVVSICEHLFGWTLGIDQLLFRDASTVANPHPGRMAQATATAFVLLGLGIFRVDARTDASGCGQSQWFALAVGLISLVSLLGYAYGVRALYGVGPYTMALHTTVGFLACS